VAAAAVAAAIGTVVGTSRPGSPPGPGGPPGSLGHPAVAVYQIPLETIPLTTASQVTPQNGDVYVDYKGGNDATAQLAGTVDSAPGGSVVRLYAREFPFTSAPALAATDTLNSGGAASYTFQVTPTLATRYQVKFFDSPTAAAPAAESAVSTVYVLASWGQPTLDCTGDSGCQASFTVTIYQPPTTLETEMPKQWYVYLGPGNGSGQSSQALTLDPNAVIGAAHQIAPDEYTRTGAECVSRKLTKAARNVILALGQRRGERRRNTRAGFPSVEWFLARIWGIRWRTHPSGLFRGIPSLSRSAPADSAP
jgi:hypothetical protein